MSLDDLVGGPTIQPEPVTARARVLRPPVDTTADMTVALDDFTAALEYEIPAAQRIGPLPAAGDVCLVVFDDEGDSWAFTGGVVTGPTGPAGPAGAAGPEGPEGPAGATGPGATWQSRFDATSITLSGGGGIVSPAKRGTPTTIMDISVEVTDAERPVYLVVEFISNANGNSNLWHQVWRNGAAFLKTTNSDYDEWLVGSGGAGAVGSAWFGSYAATAITGGLNANRQPFLPVPFVDFPGVGTHVYSLAHGATGTGGIFSNRRLRVGH